MVCEIKIPAYALYSIGVIGNAVTFGTEVSDVPKDLVTRRIGVESGKSLMFDIL